jgi:hypothetical protein
MSSLTVGNRLRSLIAFHPSPFSRSACAARSSIVELQKLIALHDEVGDLLGAFDSWSSMP